MYYYILYTVVHTHDKSNMKVLCIYTTLYTVVLHTAAAAAVSIAQFEVLGILES